VLDGVQRRVVALRQRGVALSLLDFGGRGPLALLHHANGFCAAVWAPVAEGLRERFRVVAFDARGHGDSSKPEGADAYQWAHFGRDLAALAANLRAELGPVALGLGHSFGGTATILAAAERPDLFERVALLDPVVFPKPVGAPDPERSARGASMAEGARRRRHVFPDREAVRASWRERDTFSGWDARAFEAYLAEGFADRPGGGVELKCPGEVEATIFELGGSADAMTAARDLPMPALVLWASRGNFPRAHFEALARVLRDGRVRDADTGHFVPMENPELVVREVLAFSARPGDRGAASPKSPPPATRPP
jgi:pimeloyl-ACP methyl ester carboxylesterase